MNTEQLIMTTPKDLPQLIPPHGGYRELKSYQMSEIVYDATVVFCNRFINIRSRTQEAPEEDHQA